MKSIFFLKGRLLLALFLFLWLQTSSFSNEFILQDEIGLNQKAADKIFQIGSELKSKTGSSVYIFSQNSSNFPDGINREQKSKIIKEKESQLISKMSGSSAMIFISLGDPHINLFLSKDLEGVVDKDSILDDYIVPLLASKDKNSLISKYSAAVLNGYAEITDRIAESKGLKLDSSIGTAGTEVSAIWKVFLYSMIIGGLLLYTYAVLRSKKNG